VTEFLHIKNEQWTGLDDWEPFHLKNNEDYYLFYINSFHSVDEFYINRFPILKFSKILTYD